MKVTQAMKKKKLTAKKNSNKKVDANNIDLTNLYEDVCSFFAKYEDGLAGIQDEIDKSDFLSVSNRRQLVSKCNTLRKTAFSIIDTIGRAGKM